MNAAARARALACALACLALAGPARADNDLPSFKADKDRETKEFAAKVGEAVVRAARTSAQKVEFEKYEYTKPKPGRTELLVKMTYAGALTGVVSKKRDTSDVTVVLDSHDASKWEVLNITFKDNNPNPVKPNIKNVQALIPRFNK